MATKKPSRQEYLNQRVALAESLGRDINITIPNKPTAEQLKTLDAQINKILYPSGEYGNTTVPTTTVPTYDPYAYEKSVKEENRRSAFAILEKEFTDNNLISLIPDIKKFMKEGYSSEEASLMLPETTAYKARFAGNEGRKKLGLPVYNPAQYLVAEQTYRDMFNQFNLGELANQGTYDSLIGGAVSLDEAKARIENVFTKIDNAPDALKVQLNNYLGAYGVGDPTKQRSQVALALLQGTEGVNKLDTNLRKAQIRTGAAMSNVNVTEENVSQLEKQLTTSGYSTEQIGNIAKEAYGNVAETVPLYEKLAQVSKQDTAGLAEDLTAEAINAATGVQLASQRRKKLQEQEQARFAAQSGTTRTSLIKKSAGAF